ncbi:MAG: Crp/Fnr family transcriptional regulator [Sphingobacteriia bacterium]|nr:Crp/Fnr family transcriptional regulator [Sphingobacteriia bacterium]
MKPLLDFLNMVHPLDAKAQQLITEWLKPTKIFANKCLLKMGDRCDKISWVESGLLKMYQMHEDKEYITWFSMPGDIVISVESFFKRVNSGQCIEAIRDSVVWSITYDQLNDIYGQFKDFNINGRVICQEYYCIAEKHRLIMHYSKDQRYQKLMEYFPRYLDASIPDKYLAGYLGLTPAYLSRCKHEFEQ